ncbi:hypothetical protein Tco_1194813 [Tanacetum coccineum]
MLLWEVLEKWDLWGTRGSCSGDVVEGSRPFALVRSEAGGSVGEMGIVGTLQEKLERATNFSRATGKFPENRFEVLKLLENSVKVLKILENKLESMRIMENKLESLKFQENQPVYTILAELHLRLYNDTQKLHMAPSSP